ncbi:hypothetical protein ACHGLA_00255 [Streptomyces sp. YH02]|uniref:hypothetical protein n=1 Tax=Streptomyces sp. YH02 TaxID=3256999 RepID=UPI0037579693
MYADTRTCLHASVGLVGVNCSFRELVWPEVEDLVVGQVEIVGEAVRVEAYSERGAVACPDCEFVGTSVFIGVK